MFFDRRLTTISICLIILMLAGGLINSGVAAEINTEASTMFFIGSRFVLWDLNEKMLDPEFNITLVSTNLSLNHSSNYKITVDNDIRSGNFNYVFYTNYSIDYDIILLLKIEVDNITILEANNIGIIGGINADKIDPAPPFSWLIELDPLKWDKFKWNIFWSGCIAFIISIRVGYKSMMLARQKQGGVQLAPKKN